MTTVVVVDASVAVKWFVEEDDSYFAEALARRSGGLLAPETVVVEFANVLWRKCRQGFVDPVVAPAMLAKLPQYFERIYPSMPLMPRSLEISLTIDHPIYDCIDRALAEREKCPRVTADLRCAAKAVAITSATIIPLAAITPDTAP